MNIDWPVIGNWIISGMIGLIFGVIGAWVSHKFSLKRDRANWELELEKLKLQYEQDQHNLAKERLREELLKDINNPNAIKDLMQHYENIRGIFPVSISSVQLITLSNSILELLLQKLDSEIITEEISLESGASDESIGIP